MLQVWIRVSSLLGFNSLDIAYQKLLICFKSTFIIIFPIENSHNYFHLLLQCPLESPKFCQILSALSFLLIIISMTTFFQNFDIVSVSVQVIACLPRNEQCEFNQINNKKRKLKYIHRWINSIEFANVFTHIVIIVKPILINILVQAVLIRRVCMSYRWITSRRVSWVSRI